jgi:hypothetical protein
MSRYLVRLTLLSCMGVMIAGGAQAASFSLKSNFPNLQASLNQLSLKAKAPLVPVNTLAHPRDSVSPTTPFPPFLFGRHLPLFGDDLRRFFRNRGFPIFR